MLIFKYNSLFQVRSSFDGDCIAVVWVFKFSAILVIGRLLVSFYTYVFKWC